MSRSRRHTKKFGITTAKSEKKDKRVANRKLRRKNKTAIAIGNEPLLKQEVSDVWLFDKDGPKLYRKSVSEKEMRK